MKIYSLVTLAVVVHLAGSPLAAAWYYNVSCFSDGSYAANSTYEADLRRLAVIPAEASAAAAGAANASRRRLERAVGYWPNRVQAASSRWSRDADWGACIAGAFKTVERKCPYRREAYIVSRNCTLHLAEFRVSESSPGRHVFAEFC